MTSPLTAAGAAPEPTEYAALAMDAQFTGLWTPKQRSPYRDAAVPYLERQYYNSSRFDSIIDGINREIGSALTDRRRPGNGVVYNSTLATGPVNSFYSFKYILDTIEQIHVLADTSNAIFDATPGSTSVVFTKPTGTTNRMRFLSVNTELFFADGVTQKKLTKASVAWAAAKTFTVGQFIIDTNGNVQLFDSQQTALTITETELRSVTMGTATQTFLIITTSLATAPTIPAMQPVTFAGLTTETVLNGLTLTYQNIAQGWDLDLNANQFAIAYANTPWAPTADTGTATTFLQSDANGDPLTGVTGATQPTWPTSPQLVKTQDGTIGAGVTWSLVGAQTQDWGVAGPPLAPTVAAGPSVTRWAPQLDLSAFAALTYCVLDPLGNIQALTTPGITGTNPPNWGTALGAVSKDGSTARWTNYGQPLPWLANNGYQQQYVAIVDTNGNLQLTTGTAPGPIQSFLLSGVGGGYAVNDEGNILGTGSGATYIVTGIVGAGAVASAVVGSSGNGYAGGLLHTVATSGGGSGLTVVAHSGSVTGPTQPTWNTALAGTTADNLYTWINAGPGVQLQSGTVQYAYSYEAVDGTVTTASPVAFVLYGALGAANGLGELVTVLGSTNPQIKRIRIWRTAQGQATLVQVDSIPNDPTGAAITYIDVIPDTSTMGQQALNALITAPIAKQGNPPPQGMTAPAYHLNRVWTIVGNLVQYSAGPDAVTGNGSTQWPPLNTIPYPAQPIKLRPVTVSNGGLLVYTTSGTWIILGTGTAANPFYTTIYEQNVSLAGYDAEDVLGTTPYFMESNRKVSCFDPANGYQEIGFPIGDQFIDVTTGAPDAPTGALYDPATAYVSWNLQSSGESALYVADGAVGWFRYSPIAPPETGDLWSPRCAVISGTSAVQSIETAPGVFNLLIGPPPIIGTARSICMRDTTETVWTDLDTTGTQTMYPSWDSKGVITLCQTGQIAEVAHIGLKSAAVGARPKVSILMGEIEASTAAPWDEIDRSSNDPPDLPASESVFSDRYATLQNGVCPKGDCMLMMIDYGVQAAGDQLLKFGIYGAKFEERRQQ